MRSNKTKPCDCKACVRPFEPWSPSLATEAVRTEVREEVVGSNFVPAGLRDALAIHFEAEPDYVHWFWNRLGYSAPTPWRGLGARVAVGAE